MSREVHVQFCERPKVKLLRPTHPYIPTWAGFLYLAVVLDAFSRRIVGWSMATALATQLVLDALNMALVTRRPKEVIHHSNQCTSIAFGQRCRDAGVRPSWARSVTPGRPLPGLG
jgi:transposase InsO family protein